MEGDDTYKDTIDYVTLASLGNAIDFGKLSTVRTNGGGANHTRTYFLWWISGYPSTVNIIEFVEIATTGDAQDFGDLIEGEIRDCSIRFPRWTRRLLMSEIRLIMAINLHKHQIQTLVLDQQFLLQN